MRAWQRDISVLATSSNPIEHLAQSAERKALNLVVVGPSPTVGVLCDSQIGILEQGE